MIYMGDKLVGFNALQKQKESLEQKNEVVFRDCDGTILHSYTAEQVADME